MTAPRARRSDPRTSHEAAEHAQKGADLLRARVYRVMADHGDWMTHDEIWYAYRGVSETRDWSRATEQGVRSRVAELYQDGWMDRDDGETVRNSRGRKVHQWRAVRDPDRAQANYHDRVFERVAERADAPTPEPASAWRYATEPEHLDALPLDTIILLTGLPTVVFQQTHPGRWAAPGQSARAASIEVALPALILHIPQDVDIDMAQFPTTPEG